MTRKSTDGKRTIHLHNPSAIQFLEEYALHEDIPLYKAMEKIIFNKMMVNVVEPEEHDVSAVILDNTGYVVFVDTLLRNGYTVKIKPINGESALNERVLVTFEREVA